MTSISFNESIIYSDETTEEIDYNISTTTDIDSNIIETFDVNSERDGVTEMEEYSTSLSTQDNYQHLIITTLNTNIESATITNKFTEESISTEMIDKISTILESSTLGESVISLLEKDTRYVKCFEYVCMATEDTNTSKIVYISYMYILIVNPNFLYIFFYFYFSFFIERIRSENSKEALPFVLGNGIWTRTC